MNKQERIPAEVSHTLLVYKSFAIFSVICAHCVYGNAVLNKVTSLLGSIGVPVFLLCSGYLLNSREEHKLFWHKKLRRIVAPWLLYSCITYTAHIIKNGGGSVGNLFLWWIGYGTWLYYPTILIAYWVIFRTFRSNAFAWGMISIFLVSNALEAHGLNVITDWFGSYVNIFNRIGWFAMGVLLRRSDWMRVLEKSRKYGVLAGVGVIILGIYCIIGSHKWLVKYCEMLFVLCSVLSLFRFSVHVRNNRFLQLVGNETYIIYFLHMQFGMLVANVIIGITGLESIVPIVTLFVKPLINLLSVFIGAWILKKIMVRFEIAHLNWLLGLSK